MRVLVTGISTYWGGRLAQELEREDTVETVIGVDSAEPTVELERTEFVRVGTEHALLRRIVAAAGIDTVLDTRLAVDPLSMSSRGAHENNVMGTLNILAACSGADSPVRKFVFKSSAHFYGCEQDDPSFFTEDMRRPHPARTLLEKDILEAERAVADYSARSPNTTVTVLRFVNGIGEYLDTSHMRLLGIPRVVPSVLGFDPRYQFIHEDDIVGTLVHAARRPIPGVFNAAADGVLVLSEVADLLGKRLLPILPPWGTGIAAGQLKRFGLRIPEEMLRQLKYGRGLDNRRLKAAGYEYRHTTREAVVALAESQRLAPLKRGLESPYRYEREVEEFLRWSPSVRRGEPSAPSPGTREEAKPAGLASYDDLRADELVAIVPSLTHSDLEQLRVHEARHADRKTVLAAIDRALARDPSP